MKTGKKRIISSIIFSCLAVITQTTAFATLQGAVSSPANGLRDSKLLPSGDVTAKDVEALPAATWKSSVKRKDKQSSFVGPQGRTNIKEFPTDNCRSLTRVQVFSA